jgi:hypothetical protein
VTAAADYVLAGREVAVNGLAHTGSIASGATQVTIQRYDNIYPGVSGARLVLSGVVEAA